VEQHDEDEWRQECRQAYDRPGERLFAHYCFIVRPLPVSRMGELSRCLQRSFYAANLRLRQPRPPGEPPAHLHGLAAKLSERVKEKRANRGTQ
jgi:hypothetical protein